MMEGIYRMFDSIWRLSLVGSYCILLVILARFLLKKAPKWCSYLLWGIVFVRLCCPVLPGTRISLIPERLLTVGTATTSAQLTAGNSAGSVDNEGVYNGILLGDNTVDVVLSGADNTENPISGSLEAAGNREGSAPALGQDGNVEGMNEIGDDGVGGIQAPGNVTNALDDGYPVDNRYNADGSLQTFRGLSIVWLLGMAGFMGYHAFSYLRMRNRIHRPDSGVRQVEPGICEIDGGHLSFVMGLVHPVIYLSSGLDPESRNVVLCHERVHLQRRDYLFKPAALLICCVHWFNPLVWLAFYLMNMDCEMSCDEKVVKLLGEESKKIYSYTLLEEASGGEWKRYRGGSICALLSFGEDHVKNRIRHVLDYRKPPFWMLVGAVAVLVILVVCLCSNPGGGTDAVNADNDTETGADATDMTGTSDETAEGDLTAGEVDYEAAKTEWLTVFEQGIHSREEFSGLFDVSALEDTRSFAGQDGIQYLGYDGVAARKLHQRILDGDAVAHETYKDPVKAAETLLNLQSGSGEMTELLYEAGRQYLFFQKDSTRPGEGSVANVHYIFADGSGIDIPMVFAEESSQIWMLSLGDIDSKGRHSYGPLDGENQVRIVYAEYGPQGVEEDPLAGAHPGDYTQVSQGSFRDQYATYQVSSYGIYVATGADAGLDCVVLGYIAPGYAASHWSCVYQDRRFFDTSDQCDYLDCYRDEIESVRLYYLASSDYQDGDLEIWIDTIREYDTSGQTGENGVTDWKLPSEAQDFDKASFRAEDGYWIFENSDGSEQLKLPILSVRPVWNGKTAAELTAEEIDAYAAAQRQEILTKVGVVYDVSERAAQETYALLDLDGDGTADRITLRSRMAQALNTPDHSPLDQYVFTVNTTSGEMRTAQNLGNSIYAFSPDGRQILLALTRKDEQGQYESFLFRYRNGELQEVGSFAQDIRKIWVQNGQITTGRNSDDIIFAEPNMTGTNTILDSRNSDGTPSGAYVETLQEKISADMVAGKLPFVVTSAIRENPLRLEVELTEMTDENIKIIRSYETNGSAITFAQSSGNAQELQHNNDSQSQIAPQISKEDEND
jgi:beta-lactamase regulating signal transducer with metallopeptidase domain